MNITNVYSAMPLTFHRIYEEKIVVQICIYVYVYITWKKKSKKKRYLVKYEVGKETTYLTPTPTASLSLSLLKCDGTLIS